MALLRRCTRILWNRTRFVKLYDKHKSYILNGQNSTNRGYVLHFQTQARTNFQHESNPESNKSMNNIPIVAEHTHDPQTSSYHENSSGMCYADIKKIINKKYKASSSPIEESFGLRLLESCRDMLPDADLNARRILIQEVWDLLENLDQNFTVKHYNTLLSIYVQNSQYLNAKEFLQTMKATPDKDTYRLLLETVAEAGDYSQVVTIMTKMKDQGYSLDKATFNSLILAYAINPKVNESHSVLLTMQAARIEPDAATYCALSRGFATKGDLESLQQTLRIGNLNIKQLMSVIKSLSNSGHGEYISQVMKYLPEEADIKGKDVVYTIVELTHLGKVKDAFEIINCLPVPEIETDPVVGFADFFLYEIVKAERSMAEILEICESLTSSNKNSSALLKVTEATLRLQKENMALLAFEALQNHGIEIRPHYYWPLLVNVTSNMQETNLIRLVKHMITHAVSPDDDTLRYYIIPYLSAPDPLTIVRQLQDVGIKISELLTPLLANLLSKGDLEKAIALTHQIKGKINKDIIVEQLLHGYIATKDVTATAELLKNIDSNSTQNGQFLMDLLAYKRIILTNEELGTLILTFDKKKLKISETSAEALEPRIMRLREPENLEETFRKLVDPKTSTEVFVSIRHPRDMTIEELENHLLDLEAKKMNTRGVLRKLIQGHCGKNNLSKVEKFAKMFTDRGFQWSTGMIAGMFSLYVAHDMLDEAEIRYKELKEKHKTFKIDDHKILDYATTLVKNNKLERALEILVEQENVRYGPETIRNCWRLLNAVAATSDSKNVERTLELLVHKRYCKISNHVLGPLVRIHLLNRDLEAAVAQFKQCAKIYRQLPLQQELIRAIIQDSIDEAKAQKQLAQILVEINKIHGNAAAHIHLLIALAATNKQRELYSFIKTPAVNQDILNLSIKKLTDEQNLSALERILKACRGVTTLDVTIIYDSIMTLCSRSCDYETALKVWEKMQSEDVCPSSEFIEKLKSLLKSHAVPLPPELLLNKGKKKS